MIKQRDFTAFFFFLHHIDQHTSSYIHIPFHTQISYHLFILHLLASALGSQTLSQKNNQGSRVEKVFVTTSSKKDDTAKEQEIVIVSSSKGMISNDSSSANSDLTTETAAMHSGVTSAAPPSRATTRATSMPEASTSTNGSGVSPNFQNTSELRNFIKNINNRKERANNRGNKQQEETASEPEAVLNDWRESQMNEPAANSQMQEIQRDLAGLVFTVEDEDTLDRVDETREADSTVSRADGNFGSVAAAASINGESPVEGATTSRATRGPIWSAESATTSSAAHGAVRPAERATTSRAAHGAIKPAERATTSRATDGATKSADENGISEPFALASPFDDNALASAPAQFDDAFLDDISRPATLRRTSQYLITPPSPSPTANLEDDVLAMLAERHDFSIPRGTTLEDPALLLFKTSVGPVERFHALIDTFHAELDILMPYMMRRGEMSDPELNQWKETVMKRMMIELVPRLGSLVARVGDDVGEGMAGNGAGVRTFVGGY